MAITPGPVVARSATGRDLAVGPPGTPGAQGASGPAGSSGGSGVINAFGADLVNSVADDQYVSSLSFNAAGFAHGAGGAIAVNGTGTTLNWVDAPVKLQQAGTTVLDLGQSTGNDFVAFGASPGSVGYVRAPANATIVGVAGSPVLSTDSGPNTNINAPSGQGINLNINAATQLQVAAAQILITPATVEWQSATASPTLTQLATSTATQGQDLTLTPQQSTHATNQGGGNVNVSLQAPLGTGARSYLRVAEGGTYYAWAGRYAGAGAFGAVYLGSGIGTTPSATNYALIGDGSSTTDVNAPSGGTVSLLINNVAQLATTTSSVTVTPVTVQWASATSGPTLTQASIGSTTQGQSLTVTPQQSTQATNQGGGSLVVSLQTPLGTGSRAYLQVNEGGVSQAKIGGYSTGGVYSGIYLGPGLVPSLSNYTVLSDGTNGYFNAPNSGGIIFLSVGNGPQVTINSSSVQVNPPAIEWLATVASPALLQASTGSATQGQSLTIEPQTSSQATNFGGGNLLVQLQAPGGTGAEAYFVVQRGGTVQARINSFTNGSFGAIWLGNIASPTNTNMSICADGVSTTYINGISSVQHQIGGNSLLDLTSSSFNVMVGGAVFDAWQGSANTQTSQNQWIPCRFRTTTQSLTTFYTLTLATHQSANVEFIACGRTVVAGGAPWNIVDQCNSAHYHLDAYNTSGSAILGGAAAGNLYTIASGYVSATVSGANVLLQAGGVPVSGGSAPTIDWQCWVLVILN